MDTLLTISGLEIPRVKNSFLGYFSGTRYDKLPGYINSWNGPYLPS